MKDKKVTLFCNHGWICFIIDVYSLDTLNLVLSWHSVDDGIYHSLLIIIMKVTLVNL